MKKEPLIIICLGLLLSSCTTIPIISNTSTSKSDILSSSVSESESIEIYSDDPGVEITDDSIPFSTTLSNGMEEMTLSDVLKNFKKEEYGYYGGTFEKKMDEPSSVVSTHQELVDLFDYCAFYRIKEKDITINIPGDKVEQCNLAVWDSIMLPGTVGTAFIPRKDGIVRAEFKYVDNANTFVPRDISKDSYKSYFPYFYDYNGENKAKITDIPYVGDKELDVHNSDQLIYALAHGFKPVMQSNSPAKRIYDKAVSILKDIIYVDMSDNEKMLAIEFFINNNTQYDYVSDDSASFISAKHSNNVEEVSSLFRGFYAEGVFFNDGAVCYGFAKAQALLSLLLGFEVKLTHGKIDALSEETNDAVFQNELTGNIYNAHGITLVRKNSSSKWGICDPTFRFAGSLTADTSRVDFKRSPAIMLSLDRWQSIYKTADEVAFRYIPSDEMLEKSYNFVDDYHLIGGCNLAPTTNEEIQNTLDGIVETIKKASAGFASVSKMFYTIHLYPTITSDIEAQNYCRMYDNVIVNHTLYTSLEATLYRWSNAANFDMYGYAIIVKY